MQRDESRIGHLRELLQTGGGGGEILFAQRSLI